MKNATQYAMEKFTAKATTLDLVHLVLELSRLENETEKTLAIRWVIEEVARVAEEDGREKVKGEIVRKIELT